ncbi:MAG TPA: replication-associated recombination protein A [Candidatus Baltobacteraceae bacterium]|nr:replication-associated recombination protein A [Candidatus Baltobacteraceae bacterium]
MPSPRRSAARPGGARPDAMFQPPSDARAPLAARMRPRDLAEVVGQGHLVGEHGTLTRQLRHGHLASMILWGPPGVGKTTLARLLADAAGARFETLSAVMSGVADVRALIAAAAERSATGGPPTVLFVDEIHRFNKGQQDALLPHVEAGTITLIGATTENPYHEVNSALLSRTRVMRLEPLSDAQVTTIVRRALADERGYGGSVGLDDEALTHLVEVSGGDARIALNVLEAAVALAGGGGPTREMIEAAAQQRVLAYDRAGDGHYDTVSALIKSVRGNDPDAALYWLATMVAAGEDPRFIARRLIILASEDIGNADPRGLQVAVAAAYALDWVGLPEAQYALAQATAYLASAPKSNRAGTAYWAAMADVQAHGSLPVPTHLRSATWRERRDFGTGQGYRYPHEFEGADVEQQYLPDELTDRRYYVPSDQGLEKQIGERLERVRAGRAEARARRATRDPDEPDIDPMRVAAKVMPERDEQKRRIAGAQERDAASDGPATT